MFTIVRFKANFFSRHLSGTVSKGAMRALSKLGAFVQRRTKSSIRYAANPSKPGKPPRAIRHSGFSREKTNRTTGAVTKQSTSPLRELIFFAYDSARKTVVIGPAIFLRSKSGPGRVPRVLGEGGTVTTRKPVPRTRGRKATPQQSATFRRLVKEGRITPRPREYVKRTVTIAARPYLVPAFQAELPKLPQFLREAIK